MNVTQLIAALKEFPGDTTVIVDQFSDFCVINEPKIVEHCIARPDGVVQHKRADMPAQPYVYIGAF